MYSSCSNSSSSLSYFEMNLETWRELWRVTEISDILLLIVDIRFAPLHFSPAFYHHCTVRLGKDLILVLNKIDLVATPLVTAWKHYFEQRFPKCHILLFSSAKQIKYKRKRNSKNDPDDEDQTVKVLLQLKT